ncbi:MAG TPA: heavy metal translocating P-type ATPase, partial [Acidimicrobiales bacterium]|nr:heavy metal translocating P-type ATPase [Acidimicrobiales bacterium]
MDAETQNPKDTAAAEGTEQIELLVGGMTCASCAGRVERRLNKLEGVTASVNLPLERATVTVPTGVTAEQLIAEVEKAGYQARLPEPPRPVGEVAPDPVDHEGIKVAGLKRRFGLSAALAIPVILMSMVPPLQFYAWQWLAFAMAGPVVLWGGWPIHVAAVRNLRHGTASMDTLISVGTLAAYLWSIWSLFVGDAGDPTMRMGWHFFGPTAVYEIYLEAAAGVVAFILAGRWLEARAKRSAGAALRALLELGAKEVAVLRDGREERIPAEALQVGDRFVVRPGEKVATDGVVEDGSSAIDASLLTGESVPVEVAPGASVIGATVNVGGRLVIRATRVGADTKLAQISRLVSDAQAGKAQVQRLADRISAVFVPVVIALSVGTLGAWLGAGGTANAAFTAAVAVLIIACPCALGLATPTALLVGTGRGAQLGILIKGPEVLESTQRIDTVVLDKTGTVTTGCMSLVAVVPGDGEDEGEALRLAGALEDASEHPIAQAVAAAARERHGDLPPVESFENKRGLGVQGVVEGHAVVAGRPSLLADWGAPLPEALQGPMADAEAQGQT